jgi:predicted DNA-binding transcriptional regulator YafY
MNRTDRLMGILLEFQARGELRAEDLARRFEVSVRTIYRDVQALSETGVPVVATPGKGYRLMEGYFLPPLSFTATEAALLALGSEFLRDRVDHELRRAADDALAKLFGVLPPERREDVARWRREISFSSFRRAIGEPRLLQIRTAIQERRVLQLVYHAYRRAGPDLRDVEPVLLLNMSETWHLAAYCRLRQAPRLFRLDRIDRLQVLDERFELSERHAVGPEYDEPMDRFAEARVRFQPDVARWVRERQPWVFLHEEADQTGPIFVYAVRDERELLSWLLTWGSSIEILSPPDLRNRLVREARAILERHAPAEYRELVQDTSERALLQRRPAEISPDF